MIWFLIGVLVLNTAAPVLAYKLSMRRKGDVWIA
ncbi:hypothetical protein FBY06_11587 [Pseudomonas sp. SJZ085]|nr:hypothetical protein FBX99_11587 [Pseudomonas sp. SJZ074]TWC36134.1 hypothetical protein FBY06_11587 [Pseudomonas sp. SJZ085]